MKLTNWVGVSARAWCRRAATACWLTSWWLATCFGVEVASGHFTDGLTLIEAALSIFVGLALRCVPGATSIATAMTLQLALLIDRSHHGDAIGCGIVSLVLLAAGGGSWRLWRGDSARRARSGPCPVFERSRRVSCQGQQGPRPNTTVAGRLPVARRARAGACVSAAAPAERPRCQRRTRTLPPELHPCKPPPPALRLPLASTIDGDRYKTITDPRGIDDHDTWLEPRRRPRRDKSRYRQRLEQQADQPLQRTGTDG